MLKLTTEEKKVRLLRSYVAWVEAKDVKQSKAVFAVGKFDALVKKWFLRMLPSGGRSE
jgi:hypothetical protein